MRSSSSSVPLSAAPIARPPKPAMPRWPSALPRIGRAAARSGARSKFRSRSPRRSPRRPRSGSPVLVDCLTLWLSNLLLAGKPPEEEARALCSALREAAGPVVLVANEVGMGLVPETPLGRKFPRCRGPGQSGNRRARRPRRLRRRRFAFSVEGSLRCSRRSAPHPPAAPRRAPPSPRKRAGRGSG